MALVKKFVALTLAVLSILSMGAAHESPRYHLALGDSLPYGFTTAKALAGLPPSEFSGYPDLMTSRRNTVNYSCPGETTASFIAGPCVWRAAGFKLHDDYTGSQLGAAEAFLSRQPPGRAGLVTLTLWGNDIRLFLESCPDIQCVIDRAPAEIAAFGQRLQWTVSRLRAAAPRARIVLVGAYHGRLVNIEVADQLINGLNDTIARIAAAAHASLANPAPFFNPPGGEQIRQHALCQLTLICAENDSHPTPAGHYVLATLIQASLRNP